MAADVLFKSSSFSCLYYLCLMFTTLLQQDIFHKNVILPSPLKISFGNDVFSREGTSKLYRPLAKFVKHGYHCMAVTIEAQIIIRCGDISVNPGPNQSLTCFMPNVRSLKAVRAADGSFETKMHLQDIVYVQGF